MQAAHKMIQRQNMYIKQLEPLHKHRLGTISSMKLLGEKGGGEGRLN